MANKIPVSSDAAEENVHVRIRNLNGPTTIARSVSIPIEIDRQLAADSAETHKSRSLIIAEILTAHYKALER